MVITSAFFRAAGITPVDRDGLTILVSEGNNAFIQVFNSLVGIGSNAHWVVFEAMMIFLISISVAGINSLKVGGL